MHDAEHALRLKYQALKRFLEVEQAMQDRAATEAERLEHLSRASWCVIEMKNLENFCPIVKEPRSVGRLKPYRDASHPSVQFEKEVSIHTWPLAD